MPLGDTVEAQAFISAYYGADDSGVPSSFSAALWTGNPYDDDSEEFDYPGYARQTVTNNTTNFVNGADGSATATVSFPDATDEATTEDAIVWVLFVGTAISAWEFLAEPISVDSAGTIEAIGMKVYYPNDDLVSAFEESSSSSSSSSS